MADDLMIASNIHRLLLISCPPVGIFVRFYMSINKVKIALLVPLFATSSNLSFWNFFKFYFFPPILSKFGVNWLFNAVRFLLFLYFPIVIKLGCYCLSCLSSVTYRGLCYFLFDKFSKYVIFLLGHCLEVGFYQVSFYWYNFLPNLSVHILIYI